MQLRVAATALNLRSEPRVAPNNRLAVLPQGHWVTARDSAVTPWKHADTVVGGTPVTGFVHGAYLTSEVLAISGFDRVEPVHLREDRPEVTPLTTSGRAFPIGDPNRPQLTASRSDERCRQLASIIDYLNVEVSARYAARGATTYCNVYAYDYCYLAGAYLPRVWWKDAALERLGRGEHVVPRYDDTLRELRANDLYDWFTDFGERFGWQRSFDIGDVQLQANEGRVGVIVAQRSQLGRPGHISLVVPESPGHSATRARSRVIRPLQSQAGRKNWRYSSGSRRWWQGSQFRAFGFWVAGLTVDTG